MELVTRSKILMTNIVNGVTRLCSTTTKEEWSAVIVIVRLRVEKHTALSVCLYCAVKAVHYIVTATVQQRFIVFPAKHAYVHIYPDQPIF